MWSWTVVFSFGLCCIILVSSLSSWLHLLAKYLLFCCSAIWNKLILSLVDSAFSQITFEIPFHLCCTNFSHSLLLAYLLIRLDVCSACFNIDKRQYNNICTYRSILKQNSQVRMICSLCVIAVKSKQKWSTSSEYRFWTDTSLSVRVDQHLLSVGKKQIGLSTF